MLKFCGNSLCFTLTMGADLLCLFLFVNFVHGAPVYNSNYPLTAPVKTGSVYKYRIALITDLDTDSKSNTEQNIWVSYLKKGYLTWDESNNEVTITWDDGNPLALKSNIHDDKGRGMELSELQVFDGKLMAMDDRTGTVFVIHLDTAEITPWVTLYDGDGSTNKGFKCEWSAVKDQTLYVGSIGKEWTTEQGIYVNNNPMWIKTVTPGGTINHISWVENYKKLRQKIGIEDPGYLIHEAGAWSDIHKKWFFLPRRLSHQKYEVNADESRGANVLLKVDENFDNVEKVEIGKIDHPTRGYSSFKFIPKSKDNVIVAIKSEEDKGQFSSYITAFTIDGTIRLPETDVPGKMKFEGIEFI